MEMYTVVYFFPDTVYYHQVTFGYLISRWVSCSLGSRERSETKKIRKRSTKNARRPQAYLKTKDKRRRKSAECETYIYKARPATAWRCMTMNHTTCYLTCFHQLSGVFQARRFSLSRRTTIIVFVSNGKLCFPATTSSKKVSPNDCDTDRQPEIAIWPPKPLLFPVVGRCHNYLETLSLKMMLQESRTVSLELQ